jgi:cyclase
MRIPISALAAGLSALLCATALSQTPAPFILHDLGHGAFAAIDNPAAKANQAGSSAGFVLGPTSILVVDTFESPNAAQLLLDAIHQKSTLPLRYVVNTHYHLDHVAGNALYSRAGATVIAQQNVRAWERTENLKFFGPQITPAQRASVEQLYLPDITYTQAATVFLGPNLAPAQGLTLTAMPGHTGGDTVVYDPTSNVVFCGDLFWNHTLPNLIDASTQPWIDTLNILLRDHPTATFVPGHGDNPGHAADVRAFRDYLIFLREAITKAQATGANPDAVLKIVLPQLQAHYSTWSFFDFATPDIQLTDQELRHTKRLPPQPTPSENEQRTTGN